MKRVLKHFIQNIQFSLLVLLMVSVCGLLIFIMKSMLEFIALTVSTPILGIIASALTLVVILSAFLTLFDMIV